MEQLQRFDARIVENGWLVTVSPACMGEMGQQYVFRTLEEMADWLKVQVTRDTSQEGFKWLR